MLARAGLRLRTLAALAGALATAACGGGGPQGAGLACFPAEAGRWVARPAQAPGFSGRRESVGPVTVYVDGSGSMTGYVRGGAAGSQRPFQDLVHTVPDLFADTGATVDYKLFGSRIRAVPASRRAELERDAVFSCRGVAAAECDNKETRLDLVLRDVDEHADTLAVVVTDLWFSDPSSATSGLVPLSPSLQRILASGRAIAVYGIPAPFDGTVYDLPDGSAQPFRGRKPLMVLAIGPAARVADFDHRLSGRSASPVLASGLADGSIRRALFTLQPANGAERNASEIERGSDPRIRPAAVLEAIEGVRVPQFTMSRGGADRRAKASGTPLTWSGPREGDFVEHAVWRGPLATRALVWRRRDDRCAPKDWEPPAVSTEGWLPTGSDGARRFTLEPSTFAEQFRRPGTYLVTGEVARTSLDQPNPATAWMRAWSFDATQRDGRTSDGALFRTLNLSEFARIMENALAASAERNPGPISGFTFVVRVEE
jgi:hypothetical protein